MTHIVIKKKDSSCKVAYHESIEIMHEYTSNSIPNVGDGIQVNDEDYLIVNRFFKDDVVFLFVIYFV